MGTESSVEEREEVSKIVEEALQAREDGEWAALCGMFGSRYVRKVERESPGGGRRSCVKSVEEMSEIFDPATFENTMIQPIAALRINGNRAYAFYHGAKNMDLMIPLERDGGEWKVADIAERRAF